MLELTESLYNILVSCYFRAFGTKKMFFFKFGIQMLFSGETES